MSTTLTALRESAWQAFVAEGLPTTRAEDWKYTDLSRFTALLGEQWWNAEVGDAGDIGRFAIEGLDAYRAVFVNGRFDADASELPASTTVQSLAALAESNPDALQELIAFEPEAPFASGVTAINSALASDGACICLADNAKLDKPLLIHAIGVGGATHLRHGIQLGVGAEATVIELFSGDGDAAGLTNAATFVRLGANSRLDHYRLQLEAAKQSHLGRVQVNQLRDSAYRLHAVELGSLLARVDVAVKLAEQGSECELNGLFVAAGRQHVDHHTRIEHAAPHCKSREQYRTVLDGRAHAIFNGKVVVAVGAIKTDSAQSNANLLLSDRAEIDTKPELEIYNDDVKCAHGATVGQLDSNQLFYLRSRGLSEEEAKQMLTFAFADEVLTTIDNPVVRRFIERAAFAKLPNIADLAEMLA